MDLDYIRQPEKYVQQDLFLPEDSVYCALDFPLFFNTVIRWQFNENIFYLASSDFSYLMVSGYGVRLSKKSERLQIKDGKKVVYELPFFRLKNVAVFSKGVGISSDLIEEFTNNDINLSFHDFSGKPYALIQSMSAPQQINLKRNQLLAQSSGLGSDFIVYVVTGKITNQIALLKYVVKNIKPDSDKNSEKLSAVKNACSKMDEINQKCLQFLGSNQNTEVIRASIMGYEGTSARMYWKAISVLLSDKIDFAGRQHKLPTDAVNTLLNYGYGILYAKIWSSVILAGLDPYIGFLHTEQTGKPSLVFDLIEEFRAPIVDRTVFAFVMLNRNIKIEQGLLSLETRQAFSQKMIERLSSSEYYKGEKIMLSDIILAQARKLTAYLEQRISSYSAFNFKW